MTQPKYTHEAMKRNLLDSCATVTIATDTLYPRGVEMLLELGRNAGMTFTDDQLRYAMTGELIARSPQGEPGLLREEAGREPVPATPQEGKPTDEFSAEGQGPQEPASGNSGPIPEKYEDAVDRQNRENEEALDTLRRRRHDG